MARRLSLILGAMLCVSVIAVAPTPPPAMTGARSISPAAVEPNSTQASSTQPTARMAPDTLLIGLRPGAMLDSHSVAPSQSGDILPLAAFAALGVRDSAPIFPEAAARGTLANSAAMAGLGRMFRLRLAPGTDVMRAVRTISAHPAVAYAEPDYQAHLIGAPNDPRYHEQWGLGRIDASAAWDVTTGSPDVPIAVVDSGVDISHPDLDGQIWVNPGEIAGNGLDDDSNGYVDDIHGWNMRDNNSALNDATGHGTEVAGVIAAATNNSRGIAGICWACRLMVVKVAGLDGFANYSDIAAGVLYAAQKGAKVINLSLGGASDSMTLRNAIAAAATTAVVVGGAGNSNSDSAFYPAAYDDVLAVASSTRTDTRAASSSFGTWVDISAPGEQILTTFSAGDYGTASGTSLAAAFTAGTAGLLRSLHPTWLPNQVRAQITHTADSIDGLNPGYAGKLGSGRINAGRAMTTPAEPVLSSVGYTVNGQSGGRPEPGSIVELYVTLYNVWAGVSNVRAILIASGSDVAISNRAAIYESIPTFAHATNTVPFRFSVSPSAGYGADLPFILQLSTSDGYAADIQLTLRTASGVSYVHGTLTGQQTWTADRTYVVDNDVGVAAGATLIIQPGTEVRFAGNYLMGVRGTLIADGTAERPIHFINPTTPTAGQIQFLDGSVSATFDAAGLYAGGSILRHVLVEGTKGVALTNAAPYIARSTFRQIEGLAISGTAGAGLVIADNSFSGAGLSLDRPTGATGDPISILRNQIAAASLSTNGPAIIAENDVTGALGAGIAATGALTLTANRVTDCEAGMAVSSGYVSRNLLANNAGDGLQIDVAPGATQIGPTTVVSNTLVSNHGAAIVVRLGSPAIHSNNLIAGSGQYGLRLDQQNSSNVDATGNWWGTTDAAAIKAAIYDAEDVFGPGAVSFGGYMAAAVQNAPAYIQDITVQPDTTLGIQTATFEIDFSRPMDQGINPDVTFHSARRGTFVGHQLPGLVGSDGGRYLVYTVAVDTDGIIWAGTHAGLFWSDGTIWHAYTRTGSMPYIGCVGAIAIDPRGPRWFITGDSLVRFDGRTWSRYPHGGSSPPVVECYMPNHGAAIDRDGSLWFSYRAGGIDLAHFDGTRITRYNLQALGVDQDASISAIAVDHQGVKWFGLRYPYGRLLSFDGTTWKTYNLSIVDDQGRPAEFDDIAIDRDGSKWFASSGGVLRFDGSRWAIYHPNLSFAVGGSILIDAQGTKWFVAWGYQQNGIGRFDGERWIFYPSPYPPLARAYHGLAVDGDGNIWFDANHAFKDTQADIVMLTWGKDYAIAGGGRWIDDHTWRASVDINSLVPRDSYAVAVEDARGTDGMAAWPGERAVFTVDYASQISDRTPPLPPNIFASGRRGDSSVVEITWSARDPDSQITAYRYAIGSAPGTSDIVSWTTVIPAQPATNRDTTIVRGGLYLVAGHQYWATVQARNSGGLWSVGSQSPFIAGQPSFRTLFLPVVSR